MDVFSLGSVFGTSQFYATLVRLINRLHLSNAFLSEDDLEILVRLLPLRQLQIVGTLQSEQACKQSADLLPRTLSQVMRFNKDRQLVYAAGPVLLFVVVCDNHYSAVVVDCIDRLAHVFDSSPSQSHRARVSCLLDNLHQCNVIEAPEVVERYEFQQTTTQCGVFVLSLAAHLDAWLSGEPDLMRARSDCIRDAMERASQRAGEFRIDLHTRAVNASICLFNARPSGHTIHSRSKPPTPESFQQSNLLGPSAARMPLFKLCTTGQPPVQLFIQTLGALLPQTVPIGLHEIVRGTTTVPADCVKLLHEHQFSLVVVTTAPPNAVVVCTSLLITDSGSGKCHLIMPSGSAATEVLNSLDAVSAATGAQAFSVSDNAMRGSSPAALALSIFMWWAHTGVIVPDDEVGTRLIEACQAIALSTAGTHALCDDWIFQRVFCAALDSGHRALVEAARAIDSDPVTRILNSLKQPVTSTSMSLLGKNHLNKNMQLLLQRLDECAADVLDYARQHAPTRWRSGLDAAGFAALYMRTINHPSAWALQTKLMAVFNAARRVTLERAGASSAVRTITTVVRALLAEWPAMIVSISAADNSGIGGFNAKAVALDSEALNAVLAHALGAPVDSPVPVIICPVALLADGHFVLLSVVSVCSMRDMQRRNELVLGFACTADCARSLPTLSASLGGSTSETASSTHAIDRIASLSPKNVPQFIQVGGGRIAMPVAVVKRDASQSVMYDAGALLNGVGCF